MHAADDGFKGFEVLRGVAVHLHVADVARVGHGVVGRLQRDFLRGGDGMVDRDVEAVCVIVPIRDAFEISVTLAVNADEASRETFRRRGDEGEIETGAGRFFVHVTTHSADDLEPQFLRLVRFAVVLADEGFEALGEADEAHGEGAVL